ncbi:HNH endonuclease [Ciceribacter sp. RN22]|uniref:HNH endonuclease n=1 Tax=Ciceribacter sp. RN22 TaxID=2954932 RepID=UPI0020922596|nr:HNH endonuclease [Ciceribacter sp. RN22]MCO6177333.1 HNH endonuclease [Ciceribacter sp. RN22]
MKPAAGQYAKNPGRGIFFDPTLKVDAWFEQAAVGSSTRSSLEQLVTSLQSKLSVSTDGDAIAESLDYSAEQVQAFENQIDANDYGVADAHGNVKVRGSAQRAFAGAVKRNYANRCAITGISTPDFLVAAHIVPWSRDQSIRLDPANGICLSLLVDRAFENGFLLINDDLGVAVNWKKVDGDAALKALLHPYDGKQLQVPTACAPKVEYLRRRRALLEEQEESAIE